jgi:hypothetical protein
MLHQSESSPKWLHVRRCSSVLFRVYPWLNCFFLGLSTFADKDIGNDQSPIKNNIRRHVHEFHSIYYRVDEDEILILRILGPGEDPLHQLKQ